MDREKLCGVGLGGQKAQHEQGMLGVQKASFILGCVKSVASRLREVIFKDMLHVLGCHK